MMAHQTVAECPTKAPAEVGLDRLKGIDDPRATGCPRWPEHLRLLASTGQLIEGRCRATNLCRYCQARFVAETVEALLLDGLYGAGPELYVVLTAREHLTRADCRRHLCQLMRAVRRRWPSAEWFVQVEFQQRGALHLNLLVKGVPAADGAELLELLSARWCARVDAEPVGQWIGEVSNEGGLAKYLGKRLGHGLKAEQAPPIGWRGHRTSQTGGYFNRSIAELRQEARAVFRHRALIRRAIEAGHEAHDAELVAAELEAIADATTWRLYGPRRLLGDIAGTAPARGNDPEAWGYRQVHQVPDFIAAAVASWRAERELLDDLRRQLEAGLPNPPRRGVSASEGLPVGAESDR